MGQAVDDAGNIWETDAQGNAVRMLSPAPAAGVVPLGPRDPSKARAEAREDERLRLSQAAADRAAAAADRAANAPPSGYRWGQDGKLQAIPGGPADTAKGGKAMRQGDADHLEKQINAYSYLKNSVGSFQPDYAGNTVTGELENWAQGKLNTGTPGQRDWWANFRTADNLIRNELFGASLTAGEKSAYAATTVDPSMSPEVVKQNLARRAQIARDVLTRRVSRLRSVYNKDEVDSALGEYAPDLLPADVRKEKGLPDPVEPEKTVATGDTKTEVIRGPVEKKIAAMLASGRPADEIKRFADDNGGGFSGLDATLAWRSLHPKYKGGYDVSTEKVMPTSMLNRAMASPLATIATQAANATSMGTLDEIGGAARSMVTGEPLSDTIAAANLAKQSQADLNPKSALAGNVLGGAAAMLGGGALLKGAGALAEGGWAAANPIKAAMLGDTAYGTAYGTGEQNDNRLLGGAVGGGAGLVGNRVGAGITRGLGATMRGVVDPAVERLRAAGIPLTAGEVLGGGWKKAQDASTSIFGPGNLMAARYGEGREALNRAAFNEAGQIIDTPINAVGRPGIQALGEAKNQAYSAALDPTQIDLTDPQFKADMTAARDAARNIPNVEQAQEIALSELPYRIGNAMDPVTGQMSGRAFQEAYRGLSRTAKERAPKAYGHEVGQVMQSGKDALADALRRQAPEAAEGFQNANTANRHYSVLVDAVNAARNQVDEGEPLFTPAQLTAAADANTRKFSGKAASAAGYRPFNQLSNDAQQVMSSKVNDSGTVPRALVATALLGAGGAGGYGAGGGEGAATGALAPLAIMSALNTRAGQAALTRALLQRAAPFRRAGDQLVNVAPWAGNLTGLASTYGSQALLPAPR